MDAPLAGTATNVPCALDLGASYMTVVAANKGVFAGTAGVPPIVSPWRAADIDAFTYQVLDGVSVHALVGAAVNVPVPADVRQGVAVGGSTGTLVVPAAGTVLAGVTYDNGTTGTLDLATDIAAILAKTSQLTFTASGVVADAAGGTDYTARFNSLDTVTAGIKTKTDQLTFTVSGVVADAGAADYTSRFNSLDAAVAAIPTLSYSARFDSVDADLDAIATGGGVDFTSVLAAISAVDTAVGVVDGKAASIKTKTDQLAFTADGVVADVSVSVSQAINYDARFDAIDTDLLAVRGATDQFTFGINGVNSTATVDASGIASATASAINPNIIAVADQLTAHDTAVATQLTTIQNATGAIDLTPITSSLATVNTNVLAIPTLVYTTRFNAIDGALNSLALDVGNVNIDLTPVTDSIALLGTDVDAVGATAAAIKAKTDQIVVTNGLVAASVPTTASGNPEVVRTAITVTVVNALDVAQKGVVVSLVSSTDAVLSSATTSVYGVANFSIGYLGDIITEPTFRVKVGTAYSGPVAYPIAIADKNIRMII